MGSAIDTAERIRALDPGSIPALFLLAENYTHVRSYALAEKILEEALRLHPENPHFHVLLARAMEKRGASAERIAPHVQAYLNARDEGAPEGRPVKNAAVGAEILKARASLDSWAEKFLQEAKERE
jgi:predicted Zn-dependent protease